MLSVRVVRASVIAFACVSLPGCGGSAAHPPAAVPLAATPSTESAQTTPAAPAAAPAPRRHQERHRRRSAARPPGSLPQTRRFPSAASATFHAEMAAFWRGVRTGSLAAALPAFFPSGAYEQAKAEPYPHADWVSRLVYDYRLDLEAAHALLGAGAGGARLLDVRVPAAYSRWVDPGRCYNRVGYYEVPNARVVYGENGQTRSFGIASMISWRGVWYVVHLGAVRRSTAGGVVDDATPGTGMPVDASYC